MRGWIALILFVLALIVANNHYDPGAGKRILIDGITSGAGTATSSDAIPPKRFQGPATFVLSIVGSQEAVEERCGRAEPPKKRRGCAGWQKNGGRIVWIGDACPYAERGEKYARWVCHEAGHVLGWTGEHEP